MVHEGRFVCQSCLCALRQTAQYAGIGRRRTEAAIQRFPVRSFQQRNGLSFSLPSPLQAHSFRPNSSQESPKSAEGVVQDTLNQPGVPNEEQVGKAFEAIEATALGLYRQQYPEGTEQAPDDSSTTAILSLNNKAGPRASASRSTSRHSGDAESLSYLAYRLLKHPHIFLSSTVIEKYVTIQTLLSKPESFPEAFNLYATKPQPQVSKTQSQDVSYEPSNPNAAASAIPTKVAYLALDAAIQLRKLPLALSIIKASFETSAYKKNKFVRKALPPVIGAGLTPVAAWMLAANMSEIQTGLPQETFTQIAFAGMATYAAAVGTIGYVALTSANDQMRRVTWIEGTPLRERWLREEERAAADRVACAWGFKETSRWGEEEGQNWEELKEWAGVRGMVLDKVSLMEGMQ